MGAMLDFMFGSDRLGLRSSRFMQVSGLSRGAGLRRFKTDGETRVFGAVDGSVIASRIAIMLAKLFTVILVCLLVLASGANAVTIKGSGSQHKSSQVTNTCGATATTRIKPLIMLITNKLTWQSISAIANYKPAKNGKYSEYDSVNAKYIEGYSAEPMNVFVPSSKLGEEDLLASLMSGKQNDFVNGDYNIRTSILVRSLKSAGCRVRQIVAEDDYYSGYWPYGNKRRLFEDYPADVTIIDARNKGWYQYVEYLSLFRTYYGDNVDVMLISLSNNYDALSSEHRKPNLALIPSLDRSVFDKMFSGSSLGYSGNLTRLTDIAPTVAARYGASLPGGSVGKVLPQSPGRVDKSAFKDRQVNLWDEGYREIYKASVPKARLSLINSLIEQGKKIEVSQDAANFNVLAMIFLLLVPVVVWLTGVAKFEFSPKKFKTIGIRSLVGRNLLVFAACVPLGCILLSITRWYAWRMNSTPASANYANVVSNYEDPAKSADLGYIPFVAAIIGISLAVTCLVQLVTIKFANYASGFVMVCVLNAFFWLGDGLSGSHLILNSPFAMAALDSTNLHGLSGAGFAFGGMGALVALAYLANRLDRSLSLRISQIVIGGIGVLLIMAIALPSLGDNFAGAVVFGVALTALVLKLSKPSLRLSNIYVLSLILFISLSILTFTKWCGSGESPDYLSAFAADIDHRFMALMEPFLAESDYLAAKMLVALIVMALIVWVWVKFYVAIHASETSSIVVLMFAPVTALMLLEVALNDSGASMAVYSLFLLVPLACFMSLELPQKLDATGSDVSTEAVVEMGLRGLVGRRRYKTRSLIAASAKTTSYH